MWNILKNFNLILDIISLLDRKRGSLTIKYNDESKVLILTDSINDDILEKWDVYKNNVGSIRDEINLLEKLLSEVEYDKQIKS